MLGVTGKRVSILSGWSVQIAEHTAEAYDIFTIFFHNMSTFSLIHFNLLKILEITGILITSEHMINCLEI